MIDRTRRRLLEVVGAAGLGAVAGCPGRSERRPTGSPDERSPGERRPTGTSPSAQTRGSRTVPVVVETATLTPREPRGSATASTTPSAAAGSATAGESSRTESVRLGPDRGEAWDRFGFDLAVAGDVAMVGSVWDDTPDGTAAGSASVFERGTAGWAHSTTLTAGDGDYRQLFGGAVALSGETALVGASGDDADGDHSGAAYVFERVESGWEQRAKLTPSDGDGDDRFGTSVALAGDTAVVGSVGDEDPNGELAGFAYVFERDDGSWAERAKLAAAADGPSQWSGRAVAATDDALLVSAPRGDGPGSTYAFERADGSWTRQARLSPDDAGGRFGVSLAVADDTVVVGATDAPNARDVETGAGYVFTRRDGTWVQQARLAPGADPPHCFGDAVALAGETLLVGASDRGIDRGGGPVSGAAYLYARTGTEWHRRATLVPSRTQPRLSFGISAALDGETAVVGATGHDRGTREAVGAAYVYSG